MTSSNQSTITQCPERPMRRSGLLRKIRLPMLSLLLLLSGSGLNPMEQGNEAVAGTTGYNAPPWIMYFDAYYLGGSANLWEFYGYVYDDDPATCEIFLSGLVDEGPVSVDYSGYFSVVLEVDDFGIVEAVAIDAQGEESQVAEVFVF